MSSELRAWLNTDPLSLEQAVFLALGVAPTPSAKHPPGYHALLARVQRAVQFGNLPAICVPKSSWDGYAAHFSPKVHGLDEALVYQKVLSEWLAKSGVTAMFFHAGPEEWAEPKETPEGSWPWGAHTTKNLEHLAAAGQKFWQRYDPADYTTAPLNDDVVSWLRARGVSQRTAEVMATILRADNLPTGPRT